MVQFYLDKKVDPRVVDQKKRCLLHAITCRHYIGGVSESYKETVKLLLNLLSDMINTLDNDDKTPLDLWYEKKFKYSQDEDIIALFKAYGAKTAQELHQ